MVEIPEHLLKRSREAMARAKAKKGEAPREATQDAAGVAEAASSTPAPEAAEARASEPGTELRAEKAAGPATAGTAAPVPAAPSPPGEATGAEVKPTAAAGAPTSPASVATAVPSRQSTTATAVAERPSPARRPEGPGASQKPSKQHTHRLLTVVKAGSIQQTKPEAVDKVSVWPHLLAIEFLAALACLVFLVLFSIFVNAPLLAEANYNKTPNPSKAPWYFLGLQELLAYFDPMVAGVTIPGMGIFWLMVAPYIDRNPSTDPNHRKFAIALFTYFIMFWAVLVIIGSFFRGQGYNFVFPWTDGLFFEL